MPVDKNLESSAYDPSAPSPFIAGEVKGGDAFIDFLKAAPSKWRQWYHRWHQTMEQIQADYRQKYGPHFTFPTPQNLLPPEGKKIPMNDSIEEDWRKMYRTPQYRSTANGVRHEALWVKSVVKTEESNKLQSERAVEIARQRAEKQRRDADAVQEQERLQQLHNDLTQRSMKSFNVQEFNRIVENVAKEFPAISNANVNRLALQKYGEYLQQIESNKQAYIRELEDKKGGEVKILKQNDHRVNVLYQNSETNEDSLDYSGFEIDECLLGELLLRLKTSPAELTVWAIDVLMSIDPSMTLEMAKDFFKLHLSQRGLTPLTRIFLGNILRSIFDIMEFENTHNEDELEENLELEDLRGALKTSLSAYFGLLDPMRLDALFKRLHITNEQEEDALLREPEACVTLLRIFEREAELEPTDNEFVETKCDQMQHYSRGRVPDEEYRQILIAKRHAADPTLASLYNSLRHRLSAGDVMNLRKRTREE